MLAWLTRILVVLALSVPVWATPNYVAYIGWCETGNTAVRTQGMLSSTLVQVSYPQCAVSVRINGGGVATLYSNTSGTVLANPFNAQASGLYTFYVDTTVATHYDITLSGGLPVPGFPAPLTLYDVLIGGSGGGGSGGVNNCAVNGSVGYYATSGTTVSCVGSDLTFATHTLTGGSAFTLDLSNALQLRYPTAAGFTATSPGSIGYDSTAQSAHTYINGADAVVPGFASAPAGSKCVHTSGVTGLLTETAGDCSATDLSSPPPIGDVTPNTGAFTTLAATTLSVTGTGAAQLTFNYGAAQTPSASGIDFSAPAAGAHYRNFWPAAAPVVGNIWGVTGVSGSDVTLSWLSGYLFKPATGNTLPAPSGTGVALKITGDGAASDILQVNQSGGANAFKVSSTGTGTLAGSLSAVNLTASGTVTIGGAAAVSSMGLNTSSGSNSITTASAETGRTWTMPSVTGTLVPRVYTQNLAAQVAAISDVTMLTAGAANTLYTFTGTVACESTSASAEVALTLSFTDVGSHAQTAVADATDCTALGATSLAQVTYTFIAKAGTAVKWKTTITNTPTYSLGVRLMQP